VSSGGCERVKSSADVPKESVPPQMARGEVSIRWLISKDDDPPTFYMRLFEMGPGAEILEHKHPWEHEIYILSGGGMVRIGSREYRVEEGTVIYIPPNVEHYYRASESGMSFLCVIPRGPTASPEEPTCPPASPKRGE